MSPSVAIVTGSSSGIGKATAIRLSRDFSAAARGAAKLEEVKATKGAVVLIAGNTAEVPTASAAAVGVINAAIVALAKAFADRGLRDGVQVNSVSPGPVMTGRRLSMIEKWASAHKVGLDEAKQTLLAQAGISRYGEPQDIADLMAFLISPAARWMTGTQLRVDGGEVKSI
jgi:3-oxoacyl-[acyl-carrier protein] reductase